MVPGQVCVVGAGVVGLTSAVKIQQQVPNIEVTLISEKFSPDLTSNVAAGIFLWGPKSVSAATDLSWATHSWSWWQVLRVSAPWIRTALYHDDVYIIPGQDWVT